MLQTFGASSRFSVLLDGVAERSMSQGLVIGIRMPGLLAVLIGFESISLCGCAFLIGAIRCGFIWRRFYCFGLW